jgi:hypothetical protein
MILVESLEFGIWTPNVGKPPKSPTVEKSV